MFGRGLAVRRAESGRHQRQRARHPRRTLGRPLARFQCDLRRSHVDLPGPVAESGRGDVLGGGGVGVGGDHLGPGLEVPDVQLSQDVRMGDGREAAPGVGAHGHPHALELGADCPVQDDRARIGESLGDVRHDGALQGSGRRTVGPGSSEVPQPSRKFPVSGKAFPGAGILRIDAMPRPRRRARRGGPERPRADRRPLPPPTM